MCMNLVSTEGSSVLDTAKFAQSFRVGKLPPVCPFQLDDGEGVQAGTGETVAHVGLKCILH